MRPLRYSINVTLVGCCDHRAGTASETSHRHVGGVTLPLALAELGLIDEYELVVHPRFAGLSRDIDLKLVSQLDLGAGVVATRYEPVR